MIVKRQLKQMKQRNIPKIEHLGLAIEQLQLRIATVLLCVEVDIN